MQICEVSPCLSQQLQATLKLGAGRYQLGTYVGSHKALIVIDGVEEECKLVRLRMAPVSAEP